MIAFGPYVSSMSSPEWMIWQLENVSPFKLRSLSLYTLACSRSVKSRAQNRIKKENNARDWLLYGVGGFARNGCKLVRLPMEWSLPWGTPWIGWGTCNNYCYGNKSKWINDIISLQLIKRILLLEVLLKLYSSYCNFFRKCISICKFPYFCLFPLSLDVVRKEWAGSLITFEVTIAYIGCFCLKCEQMPFSVGRLLKIDIGRLLAKTCQWKTA